MIFLSQLPAEQREAKRRLDAGEQVNFSTGIDGYLTYGYGKLDQWGFWQYPLRFEWLTPEQRELVKADDVRVSSERVPLPSPPEPPK
jgi:hypothetical protein